MRQFITLILVCACLYASAQLEGNYSIDNTLPTKKTNFNTITEAITALQYSGVKGDVIFTVKSGDYYEPIILDKINIDGRHQIVFKAGENEKVTFRNENIGLLISESNNISIDNIDFYSRTTVQSPLIILSNTENIELSNSHIVTLEQKKDDNFIISLNSTSVKNKIHDCEIQGTKGIEILEMSNNNKLFNNKFQIENKAINIKSSLHTAIDSNIIFTKNIAIEIDGYIGHLSIEQNEINASQFIHQTITYRPSNQKVKGFISQNTIKCETNAILLTNNVEKMEISNNFFDIKQGEVVEIKEIITPSIKNVTIVSNDIVAINQP